MYIFLPFCHSLSILVYLSSFVYFSFYLIVYPQVPRYACFAFNLTLNSSFALFTYAVSALRYIRYLFINVLFIFELPTTPIWSFCLNSRYVNPFAYLSFFSHYLVWSRLFFWHLLPPASSFISYLYSFANLLVKSYQTVSYLLSG